MLSNCQGHGLMQGFRRAFSFLSARGWQAQQHNSNFCSWVHRVCRPQLRCCVFPSFGGSGGHDEDEDEDEGRGEIPLSCAGGVASIVTGLRWRQ